MSFVVKQKKTIGAPSSLNVSDKQNKTHIGSFMTPHEGITRIKKGCVTVLMDVEVKTCETCENWPIMNLHYNHSNLIFVRLHLCLQ